MIGTFEFGGVNSRTHDLITKSLSRPIFPAMRPRTSEVFGKHGVIDYGNNTFGTRQISMHIAYIGISFLELRQRAREIASWLNSSGWVKLIIDDEPDKYYLARVYSQIDFQTLQRLGECDVVFECQPFAYMVLNTNSNPTWDDADFPWVIDMPWVMNTAYTFTVTENTNLEFYNPGTVNIGQDAPQGSKFLIIITGTWDDILFTLNNKTLEYTEVGNGTLTINNIDMEVDLLGTNKLSKLDGDIDSFLHAVPGTNILSVSGTNLNVTLTVDFIPMWI